MKFLLASAGFPDRLPVFDRQPAFEMLDSGRNRHIGERGDRSTDLLPGAIPDRDIRPHAATAKISSNKISTDRLPIARRPIAKRPTMSRWLADKQLFPKF